jgi:hypothetical protein
MKGSNCLTLVLSLSSLCLVHAQITSGGVPASQAAGLLGSAADDGDRVGTVGEASSANRLGWLVLYDNFNSKRINPAKWDGTQNFDPDLREASRELEPRFDDGGHHRLRLMHRAYSSVADDNGSSGGLWGLSFPNPGAVTAVAFAVAVNEIAVTSCSSNPGIGVTAAEFRGNFFNTQSSPTSSIGDVLADVNVGRSVTDTGHGLTVAGFVNECADQFCGAQTNLAYQVLGEVNEGTTNILYLQWDRPNHQFIFRLNNESPVYEPYSVADSTPPFFDQKSIDLARVVAHCSTTPRPFALLDADFDNVYVNP